MSFTPAQIDQLKARLEPSYVLEREAWKGGPMLSYVEAWRSIDEANRIFGFDCWERETIYMNLVCAEKCTIGQKKTPGWDVGYLAKVRVTIDGLVREGTGFGQGIDRNLGKAHESAAKEAESDAMKRALMTFGNPFGLELYDKARVPPETQAAAAPAISDAEAKRVESMKAAIEKTVRTQAQADKWVEKFKDKLTSLSTPAKAEVWEALKAAKERGPAPKSAAKSRKKEPAERNPDYVKAARSHIERCQSADDVDALLEGLEKGNVAIGDTAFKDLHPEDRDEIASLGDRRREQIADERFEKL